MSASNKKKMRKEQTASAMTEKQQAANIEAKKLRTMTISFIVVIALIFGAFAYITVDGILTKTAVFEKNTIIANIDGVDLNMIDFSYYYIDAVEAFYNNLYQTYSTSTDLYLSTLGLDLSKPLDQQMNEEIGDTWFAYFYEDALSIAKRDFVMNKLAENDPDFDATEAIETAVSNAQMNLTWMAMYGYGSVDAYLRNKYCNGANESSYLEYARRSTTAVEYIKAHQATLNYTDADIRAYEEKGYNKFSSFDFASYTVSYESFLTGGQEDEEGNKTYSDAEKDAARLAAKAAAEKLAENTTIEDFDAAIAALSFNEGKTVSSNKNPAILYSSLKEVYAQWLGDAERKAGDMKAFPVETTVTDANGNEKTVVNSYTVVMYQDTIKNLMKISNVRHLLVEFGKTGKDDNGNAITSADDKAAAKAKATELYEQWKNDGGTEEKLIELTNKCLEDLTAKDGGLLENITPDTNYVENFLKWSIDPERKEGDSEVIETEHGYHIMYFVDHSDLNYRDYMINNTLINEAMDKWYEETLKTVTATNKDIEKLDMVVNNNLI